MAQTVPLTKFSAFVSGESKAEDIIFNLTDAIASAKIPAADGSFVENKWEKVYESRADLWVTYQELKRSGVQGKYKHTDGKLYDVLKIASSLPELTKMEDESSLIDEEGYLREVDSAFGNRETGKKIQVRSFDYVDSEGSTQSVTVPGSLIAIIPDRDTRWGVKVYLLKQVYTKKNGVKVDNTDWNEFELITEMPRDWDYALSLSGYKLRVERNRTYTNGNYNYYDQQPVLASKYSFTERYYVADPTNYTTPKVVLKATPDVPEGISARNFFIMFTQPQNFRGGDYNYFDCQHGVGFIGRLSKGDPSLTYKGICNPSTVSPGSTPVVLDQTAAEAVYEQWNDPEASQLYTPPMISWEKDYDGVTELISPASHFFYGRNSTVKWLPNKKRRPDYLVNYHISINNDRAAVVIEGDPSPNIHGYYRNFGYFGKIVPFNDHDHIGNFGLTVGMGDLNQELTGYTKTDILTELNPGKYAQYGEYTSNGMDSVSLLRTRGNVLYQAHYPAFITQLPNYPNVGSIPRELSKLVLDKDGFQKSLWTGKYHASPVYLVHQAEGYRGYMDGVVAIYDQNLVNLDELIVDTEIPKDNSNPAAGNWTEVYKFFSIKSPMNFFKQSPAPDQVTIAILKEIK
ncbi:hypothetical protein SAMN05720606_11232 [Paenibacillus polysaccharolyticus]|uniref:Uncharacterized protein n=1 Tax=Paenibacillus polysaccharolyticus TaxID=582692 RepID=A0A1G5JVF2_9BACL|nr:hypothetical protein [Paenibacillus polysaccharolyticus]SCY91881.1 hypothetical protein SAMN05720606_11232 [Paenibacillus polysaccharolyticus]